MITPNGKQLDGEEITPEESWLDYRELYLTLQRALLKNGMSGEMKQIGETYEKNKQTYEQTQNKILASSPKVPSKTDELFEEENRTAGNSNPLISKEAIERAARPEPKREYSEKDKVILSEIPF